MRVGAVSDRVWWRGGEIRDMFGSALAQVDQRHDAMAAVNATRRDPCQDVVVTGSRERAILVAAACAVGATVLASYPDGSGAGAFWIVIDLALYAAVWRSSVAALVVVKFLATFGLALIAFAAIANRFDTEPRVLVTACLYAAELLALRVVADRRQMVVVSAA